MKGIVLIGNRGSSSGGNKEHPLFAMASRINILRSHHRYTAFAIDAQNFILHEMWRKRRWLLIAISSCFVLHISGFLCLSFLWIHPRMFLSAFLRYFGKSAQENAFLKIIDVTTSTNNDTSFPSSTENEVFPMDSSPDNSFCISPFLAEAGTRRCFDKLINVTTDKLRYFVSTVNGE